jgi:steroid 5-alpha reductase family enzyme
MLASRVAGGEMSTGDIIIARVLMGLVLIEWFADQQQWSKSTTSGVHLLVELTFLPSPPSDFQNAKREYHRTAKVPPKFDQEDLDRGFVVTGLWSWSRHPNYVAEQGTEFLVHSFG